MLVVSYLTSINLYFVYLSKATSYCALWILYLLFHSFSWNSYAQVKEDNTSTANRFATLQYLGTGGVLLKVDNQGILTDPFFSNPRKWDLVLFRQLQPKRTVINQYLPVDADVRGILVGHGHYDHLMDVPYVASLFPDTVKIWASNTVINQLAPAIDKHRLENVSPAMVAHDHSGAVSWLWLTESLRVLPIQAGHSSHIAGRVLMSRRITRPKDQLPGNFWQWQSGQTLGFVMEWLRGDEVVFRCLYLSSATEFPLGIPPDISKSDPGKYDLMLLSVAKFRSVEGYPEGLLKTIMAREIVMLHWEKFWLDYEPGKEQPIDENSLHTFRKVVAEIAPHIEVRLLRRTEKHRIPLESGYQAAQF